MRRLARRLAGLPGLRTAAKLYTDWQSRGFPGSEAYWTDRYRAGGTSGPGSYDRLADYKAAFLNGFVSRHAIRSVIEHGCGDGNQLLLADYPEYLGFDISEDAVTRCRRLFQGETAKRFELSHRYSGERADLSLSLDVLYHLVEDEVFESYMKMLFGSGGRFVIVYSSDTEDQEELQPPHVRHRQFTTWVSDHLPEWRLIDNPENPLDDPTSGGSFARFFVFARQEGD